MTASKDREPLADIETLANDLQVPKSWIYSQTRQKGPDSIPCFRVGKYVRFDRDEVREWLRRKQSR